jgi:transposase-like protein
MSLSYEASTKLFRGRHFNHEIITLCIRWYVTYKLSYRDRVEMMAERHIDGAHTTIMRWVQRYVPEFVKRWQRHAQPVGASWRCDETYIRIKGYWSYLYRAVDREGQTVDFFLSEHRDIAAAKRFFAQAIEKRGIPQKITLDGYAASHVAVSELQEEVLCRQHSLCERTVI